MSLSNPRPAPEETYMYSQDSWDDNQGILWKFQEIVHEELFNVGDLRKVKNLENLTSRCQIL